MSRAETEIRELVLDAYNGMRAAVKRMIEAKDKNRKRQIFYNAELEGLRLLRKAVEIGYIPEQLKMYNEERGVSEDLGSKFFELVAKAGIAFAVDGMGLDEFKKEDGKEIREDFKPNGSREYWLRIIENEVANINSVSLECKVQHG